MKKHHWLRPLITLVIGVIIIVATYNYFNQQIARIAPTAARAEEVIRTGDRAMVLGLQRAAENADSLRTFALVFLGAEVLVFGFVLIQSIKAQKG